MAMSSKPPEPTKGGQPQQDTINDGSDSNVDTANPTKNVLDLVKAESKYQDGMRDALQYYVEGIAKAEQRFQDAARDFESKLSRLINEAETRRIDQLANLRMTYESKIADMLRTSVESTSSLVSTQLVQIQSTFNERVSQLEKFRYESGGRSSVADPALAQSLASIGSGMTAMQSSFVDTLTTMAANNTSAMNKMSESIASLKMTDAGSAGNSKGRGELWGWIVSGIVIAGTILNIAVYLMKPIAGP